MALGRTNGLALTCCNPRERGKPKRSLMSCRSETEELIESRSACMPTRTYGTIWCGLERTAFVLPRSGVPPIRARANDEEQRKHGRDQVVRSRMFPGARARGDDRPRPGRE